MSKQNMQQKSLRLLLCLAVSVLLGLALGFDVEGERIHTPAGWGATVGTSEPHYVYVNLIRHSNGREEAWINVASVFHSGGQNGGAATGSNWQSVSVTTEAEQNEIFQYNYYSYPHLPGWNFRMGRGRLYLTRSSQVYNRTPYVRGSIWVGNENDTSVRAAYNFSFSAPWSITSGGWFWSRNYYVGSFTFPVRVYNEASTVRWAPRPNGLTPTPASVNSSSATNSNVSSPIVINHIITNTSVAPLERVTWRTGGPSNTLMSTTAAAGTLARSTIAFSGTAPPWSSNYFTTIGRWTPSIVAADGDGDRTTVPVQFTVSSNAQLPLTITYGTSASNTAIRGQVYTGVGTQLCGGEDGWTNQHLTFTAGDGTNMTGNAFARHLTTTSPGFATLSTSTGPSIRANHRSNTASGGNTAYAQATVIGSPTITLSARAQAPYKIDITNPSPSVQHNGGTSFSNTSTDALSGLSTRADRKTKVALVLGASSVTPPDSDFHDFDNVPTMPPGMYSLYVRAWDKAGNVNTVRQMNNNLRIAGNVSVSKDTNLGATLHADGCTNRNLITRPGSCTVDCQVGANVDAQEVSEITYILRLRNSDPSTNATGTFTDQLPVGFVPIGSPTRVNITGSGNISGLTSTLSGGRYTVGGNFTGLSANAEMEIRIRGTLPTFDTNPGATNIVQNQASITWQIGTGASAANGTAISNYANHRVTQALGVSISKDSDKGATLHVATCVNQNQINTFMPCTPDCQVGTNIELMGETELTYILRLKNNNATTSASGTFSDVLPAGFERQGLPTWSVISGTGTVTGTTYFMSGGIFTATGSYTLSPNAEIEVRLRGTTPAFDPTPGATNIISNQATLTWQIGTGATQINGTATSNYANHRINQSPTITKASNWGAAIHGEACANTGSLTLTGTCNTTCVAGNPGTVQEGDLITYQLTFHNPSNVLQYFATDALANYDLMPTNLDMTNQGYNLRYITAGGVTSTPWNSIVTAAGIHLIQGTPYTDGTLMHGLTLRNNRIYQQGNSAISIGPGATVILTVRARVTGNPGDVLTNQVITGFSATGSNTANLRLSDPGVTTMRSNYVTHHLERGTKLNKWAYSNTNAANNPATHAHLCPNAGSMLTLVGCTTSECASGAAKLQNGNIVTYALNMDNSQSSRVARNLAGIVQDLFGNPTPGLQLPSKHLDNQIPAGLTPDVTTLRAYVTDANGNNISISNGGMGNSTAQTVNENGTMQTRQVMELSLGLNDIYNAGTGDHIFQLQGLNLYQSGTQWIWETDNIHLHRRGTQYDQGTYSITYLFDAEVTGAYDDSVPANNFWSNRWEQHNVNLVLDPEATGIAVSPFRSILHSNSVLHQRTTEGVDTLFTKVSADNLTQGLAGTEFALYRWDGAVAPTQAQLEHIVDAHTALTDGDWVRVKLNGEDATAMTDIFTSATSPLGEVDLGKLSEGIYTLIELKTVAGYELPAGQWILTIDPSKGDTGAGDWKIDFVGKSSGIMPPAAIRDTSGSEPVYAIINTKPFSIGVSGLGGTRGMLLIGFALMTLSGNIYVAYSHKSKKKNV